MTPGAKAVAALAAVVALLGTVIVAVRGAYGAFKPGYTLTATFDRAAYGFGINTEIDHLGIDVGHVSRIRLQADHQVEAFLRVDKGFLVPVGTKAEVHNRSLFGDPYVDLVFPTPPGARRLVGGDRIEGTSVDADTGDLIRTTTPLLNAISGQDLLSLITELDQASQGEGPKIAQSIHDGAQLAALYSDTITAQLRALDAFSAFQSAITPTAPAFNTLAAQGNRALPTLNAAEADFQQALDTVSAFAAKLANVIAQERPDFDALLQRGDNVVRLLAMREPQIEQVISGLALYFQKFAQGAGPETLPDGTKFAYFKNFVEFGDVVNLICGLIAPSSGGPAPSQLQPVVTALASAGLGCSPSSAATAAATSAPGRSAGTASQDLVNQVAGQIGAPEPAQHLTVGDLVNRILGQG